MAYSSEIDTELKIICFPTFPGMELYENYPLLVKHKWLIPAYWCYRIVRLLFSKERRDYVLREVKAVEKVAVRKNNTEAK